MRAVADVPAGHLDGGEGLVGLRIGRAQLVRDLKAVDQDALAPAAGELEAVEQLQPRRIKRIGSVGVRPQLEVGVGGIRLGQVGREIPRRPSKSGKPGPS
jgi:hypothetical protein